MGSRVAKPGRRRAPRCGSAPAAACSCPHSYSRRRTEPGPRGAPTAAAGSRVARRASSTCVGVGSGGPWVRRRSSSGGRQVRCGPAGRSWRVQVPPPNGGQSSVIVDEGASCEKRVRPSFCLRRRGERGSADGKQRSQDGSDRHRRRGAGDAGVHGACLPVMRASTREEMRRISFTSRSSSRLFLIHSR